MKAKKKGNLLMSLGVLFLAAAIGLAVWNMHSENSANVSSAEALQQISAAIPEKEEAALYPGLSMGGESIVANPEEIEYPDYILDPEMDMPEVNIDGWDYIGVLDIPALGLSLPVISSWSYPALNVAPCRYMGSAYMDDLIIAAHNFNCHFGQLKNLSPDSEIIFTDMDGNRFEYRVVLTETLQPTAVEEMCADEWDLTLFTCTVGGQYRVTVRCERLPGVYDN